MLAFADHGTPKVTIDTNVEIAHNCWSQLASLGIDVSDVALQLEREGVESFQKSFSELISALEAKDQAFRR
jgi:transaldolase